MDRKKTGNLPALGDYSSRKEWENICWRKISSSEELLRMFTTKSERRNIIRRAAAVESIAAGKSYVQIGKELFLSPQTISGINKAAKENGYRTYRERSKTERKKKIYSQSNGRAGKYPKGRPQRTKYGIVHMPY